MRTDIPLKVLTRHCAADLLDLLGTPASEVLAVETIEMPASKQTLDNVLRLRDNTGREYLHIIEWQAYTDKLILWRTLGYLAWLGQRAVAERVLATIVYINKAADAGDLLDQRLDDGNGWFVRLPCIRLWELDVQAIIATGSPGMLILSPLMRGATGAMAEAVARQIMETVAPPVQHDLLAALGVFAEPLIDKQRFVRLVTRERLMQSELIQYLTEDMRAEMNRTFAVKERDLERRAQRAEQERVRAVVALQQGLIAIIEARTTPVPANLVQRVTRLDDPTVLQQLMTAVLHATDSQVIDAMIPPLAMT